MLGGFSCPVTGPAGQGQGRLKAQKSWRETQEKANRNWTGHAQLIFPKLYVTSGGEESEWRGASIAALTQSYWTGGEFQKWGKKYCPLNIRNQKIKFLRNVRPEYINLLSVGSILMWYNVLQKWTFYLNILSSIIIKVLGGICIASKAYIKNHLQEISHLSPSPDYSGYTLAVSYGSKSLDKSFP